MSMPMHLSVVVVGEKSGIAGIVAAVLRGKDIEGINPKIFAATTLLSNEKSPFFISGTKHKFLIPVALPCQFINPREIDLWITLDDVSEKDVRRNIETYGPAPNDFYRGVFQTQWPRVGSKFAQSLHQRMVWMNGWIILLKTLRHGKNIFGMLFLIRRNKIIQQN